MAKLIKPSRGDAATRFFARDASFAAARVLPRGATSGRRADEGGSTSTPATRTRVGFGFFARGMM
jgi:hypothetical protein